ncbi:MAG: hypothetical protein ACAI44_06825 [Candidatus Sericytochromatia bacterium]
MLISEAAVVLHLHIRVQPEKLTEFWDYVQQAFPVFEARGDCKGMVYAEGDEPGCFDEVFYYQSEAAYLAGEKAIRENPVEIALLAQWRSLLAEAPRVEVQRRVNRPGS